jgi:hypothetical protein
MRVQQALFTSAQTQRGRGYHLVARSEGINEDLARDLSQWSPSHASLLGSHTSASSVSCHPVADDWIAVTRTVYGGPEYSHRGSLQVVSRILVLRREQLAGYACHALSLVRVALSLGFLGLLDEPSAVLPTLELPETSTIGRSCGSATLGNAATMQEILGMLQRNQRLALIGARNPLQSIDSLLRALPIGQRLDISFTSGLRPARQRPFRLHLLPEADTKMRTLLTSHGIHCVTLPA